MTGLRIAFVPLMERGHVHPLIGVMQQLQADGHTLACLGNADPFAAQLAAAGITCAWPLAELGKPAPTSSPNRTAHLRDPKKLLRWCALGINNSLVPANVEVLRAAIRDLRADVVCVDPMAYPGCVAAELEGVPWAAISPLMVSAADPAWRYPWVDVALQLQPMVEGKLRELGAGELRLDVSDVISPWLNTMFVTEAFAPRAWSGNSSSWYLGPSRPLAQRGDEVEFPWERLRSDVPIIYVAAGGGQSLSFEANTFVEICHALSPDEAQFVCSLQGLYDDALVSRLPASTIAVRYAPQLELLTRHAAVAITHGGINSVAECVTAGCPMLVVPIGHEQFLQARAVERQQIGLALDLDALTAAGCREALLRLLDPRAGFRAALEPIQRSYAVNGAPRAAELIATLGRTRAPLPPER